MLSKGVICVAAGITSGSKFSAHLAHQVECNRSYLSSYPFNKCQQSGSHWRYVHSIRHAPQRSGERDGQVVGPPLPIHYFPGNWRSRCPVFLKQLVIRILFSQNRLEVVYRHVYVDNATPLRVDLCLLTD